MEILKGITPYLYNPTNHKKNCKVWARDEEARQQRMEKNQNEYECEVQNIELSTNNRWMPRSNQVIGR